MALRLRLTRMGSKKRPFYRIVAVNSENRRDGRALDYVGYYNPMVKPADIKVDTEKVNKWINGGPNPRTRCAPCLKKPDAANK